MKWTKHIQKIYGAALGKLKKLSFNLKSTHLGINLKKHLYEENIRSQMEYGNLAWGRSKDVIKLEKIQKQTLLTISDLTDAWQPAIEGEYGLHCLESRRHFDNIKYLYKLFRMDDDRIPKRIISRKWTKNKTKSFLSHTNYITKRWRMNSPEEIDTASREDIAEDDPDIQNKIKNAWKSHAKIAMNLRKTVDNAKNHTENNKFYRHLIPSTNKIKSYLYCYNKGNKLKLAATTASLVEQKCPLCNLNDIILSRHILLTCGATYKPRIATLNKLRIKWKRNNYDPIHFMNTLYNADPTNQNASDYLETAATSYESALNKIELRTKTGEELLGKVIDIRQNGVWCRTRIVKYNNATGEVTIDSKHLDAWPFNYNIIKIDELKTDELKAIKIRDNNSLSFIKLGSNAGKTIYMKGLPYKLIKYTGSNKYDTSRGKINLKFSISIGSLNECPFNVELDPFRNL